MSPKPEPTRTQIIAAALWAETIARYPDEPGSTSHTAGPGQPVWQHLAAAVEAVLDEKPTFLVRWSYSDIFGKDQRGSSAPVASLAEAQYFASRKFADIKPDAWWIEATTTVECHGTTWEHFA